MANKGYAQTLLNRIKDANTKGAVYAVIEEVLDNFRFGLRGSDERGENGQFYRFDVTTPATADEEFSVTHQMGIAPTALVFSMLPLNSSGAQIVNLKTTRPADANRIYLSSPSTSAAISIVVEV